MKDEHISNLEDHLGYWLRCLSNYVHHTFAKRLAMQDVSVAQWVVLRTLYGEPNITLNTAVQRIGVDKSSLSRMVERLVQKDLLTRTEDQDRRFVRLALTLEGKKLVPQLARMADENDETFFSSLSQEDRQKMLQSIQQLLKANGWDSTQRGKDRME